MADITAWVTFLDSCIETNYDNYFVRGEARVSDDETKTQILWETEIPFNAGSTAANTTMLNAAITAAEDLEFTIGILDNRTLLGGAVGL